jgi:uncharacterized protein
MRAPPRLRGGVAPRFTFLVLGLFVFAAGIVALLESRLGLSPWDVHHQGIAKQTPLSFGAANVVVVALAWALGARIGVGTLANAMLVGVFVQLLTSFDAISGLAEASIEVRVGLLFVGVTLMAVGSALYLGAGFGAGPRDSLMVVGAQRAPLTIGAVRTLIELVALVVGFALGGTVGVGTLAFAVAIGPAVEGSFRLLERTTFVQRGPVLPANVA